MIVGVGMELVETEPYQRWLDGEDSDIDERMFTPDELAYCRGMKNGGQHLAARHAAKRALLVALGLQAWGRESFGEIEVVRQAGGQPKLAISGKIAAHCREAGVGPLHVSLSHAGGLAVALVVVESEAKEFASDEAV